MLREEIGHRNATRAQWVIDACRSMGLRYVAVAPGSRSTSLVAAVAARPDIEAIVGYDERGLAYHAMGVAKTSGKPAMVITTSGTAVLNLLPAIAEAHHARVPLVVMTADRPARLHGCGANQTTRQKNIFSPWCCESIHIELSDPDLSITDEILRVRRALALAIRLSRPVHVNVAIDEPFLPDHVDRIDKVDVVDDGMAHSSTHNAVDEELIKALHAAKRGVIVAGMLSRSSADSAAEFINKLQWPVWADLTSHLRMRQDVARYLIPADVMPWNESNHPDCILHLGGPIVSRWVETLCESVKTISCWHVADGDRSYEAPIYTTHRSSDSLADVAAVIKKREMSSWCEAGPRARSIIETREKGWGLHALSVAHDVMRYVPDDHLVCVASSQIIRALERVTMGQRDIHIESNRGLSGIDGLIATATGCAVGAKKRATVLVGDLAFIHDMNALHLMSRIDQPLVIVVLNNHGGEIFRHLPIAQRGDLFEHYFETPHSFDFSHAAAQFGVDYQLVTDRQTFRVAYQDAVLQNKSMIIEVPFDAAESVDAHRELHRQWRASVMP